MAAHSRRTPQGKCSNETEEDNPMSASPAAPKWPWVLRLLCMAITPARHGPAGTMAGARLPGMQIPQKQRAPHPPPCPTRVHSSSSPQNRAMGPEACPGLLSPLPFSLPRKILAHLCQSLHCSEPPGPWQSPRASGTCAQLWRGPCTLPGRYSDLRWTPVSSGPTRLPAAAGQASPTAHY